MPGPQRADADIIWLLTVELTGLTFRLSTQPITIYDATTAAPVPPSITPKRSIFCAPSPRPSRSRSRATSTSRPPPSAPAATICAKPAPRWATSSPHTYRAAHSTP